MHSMFLFYNFVNCLFSYKSSIMHKFRREIEVKVDNGEGEITSFRSRDVEYYEIKFTDTIELIKYEITPSFTTSRTIIKLNNIKNFYQQEYPNKIYEELDDEIKDNISKVSIKFKFNCSYNQNIVDYYVEQLEKCATYFKSKVQFNFQKEANDLTRSPFSEIYNNNLIFRLDVSLSALNLEETTFFYLIFPLESKFIKDLKMYLHREYLLSRLYNYIKYRNKRYSIHKRKQNYNVEIYKIFNPKQMDFKCVCDVKLQSNILQIVVEDFDCTLKKENFLIKRYVEAYNSLTKYPRGLCVLLYSIIWCKSVFISIISSLFKPNNYELMAIRKFAFKKLSEAYKDKSTSLENAIGASDPTTFYTEFCKFISTRQFHRTDGLMEFLVLFYILAVNHLNFNLLEVVKEMERDYFKKSIVKCTLNTEETKDLLLEAIDLLSIPADERPNFLNYKDWAIRKYELGKTEVEDLIINRSALNLQELSNKIRLKKLNKKQAY